jgi:hypothetical protein
MKEAKKALQIYKIHYLYLLAFVCIGLIGLHIYFAFYTSYLAARTDNTRSILKEYHSELSVLEQEYISVTRNIDIRLAYKMGLRESTKETRYITRDQLTAFIDNNDL